MRFTCWFSRKFFDIHSYSDAKLSDPQPLHFFFYTCPDCGERFMI